MNNIYLQDVENRIANNPEKTRLLLSKYGVETPEPTLRDIAIAYHNNPKFLSDFYQMTTMEYNNNDQKPTSEEQEQQYQATWLDWGAGVSAALAALFGSLNNSKNAEQNAQLQIESMKTQQSLANAQAKKSSTTIWIVALLILAILVGVIVYLTKKKK